MRITPFVIGAAILVAACGADTGPTDVTATAVCTDTSTSSQCVVEASDDRVEGTEFMFFAVDNAADTIEGALTLENEGGSWFGKFSGVIEETRVVSQFELVGSGGYEGLVYTFESIYDFASATAQRTGKIQQAD